MLAMVVNDDAGSLIPRGAPSSIASMLAPTEGCGSSNEGAKKAPHRGAKRCSSHALGRLSMTWQALPSERLIEWNGCRTIRELMPM